MVIEQNKKALTDALPAPPETPPTATAPPETPPPLYAEEPPNNSDRHNIQNPASGNRYNKGGNYAGRGGSVSDNSYSKIDSHTIGRINVAAGATVNIERTGKEESDTTGVHGSARRDHHHRGDGDHGGLSVNKNSSPSLGNSHELSSKQTTGIIIGVFVLIIIIILVVMFATRCFGSSDTAVNSSEDATNNPSGSNDGASNDTTNNPSGSNDGASNDTTNNPSGSEDGASNDTTNNPSGSNDSGNQKETT